MPNLTYSLDGEGRVNSVTDSGSRTLVSGTTYNNASLPTQVTFGSGDNDIFAYDSNTMRMTQFKFNVGTQYLNGVPTWNANGSLGQLAITDQFNSSDTQTCNYAHDDLARIASANCGGAANQSFSYDAFGNISKSGSPYAFQPTYNSATNRFATIPGTTPSYDSNGNVLSDGSHTYAWDADGNSVTVDTVGLTFDAFDRQVEQARGTTYTQIVYTPTGGKLALMNGQSTLVKGFAPLPGGVTAVYTSSGLDHYRHSDWLGSARLTSSPSRSYISSVAYAPFGETYASSGTTDTSFTGQNPDTVSTDYDFLYRPYSTQGRWPTPDPSGLAAVNPSNPQSWNRYAYVLNNPLSYIDPLGLECVWDDGSYDSHGDPVTGSQGRCESQGGTWIDPSFFSDFGFDDWSGAPVSDLAAIVSALQNGLSLVQIGQGINGWMLQPTDQTPNWTWELVKSFVTFRGGPGNVPTCAGQALGQMGSDLLPFTPSASTTIEATAPAVAAVAFNSAVAQTHAEIGAYIAAKGLTTPLRSGVVRAMAAQGAKNAAGAATKAGLAVELVAVDAAALHSTYTTSVQARSGTCSAAFPIF